MSRPLPLALTACGLLLLSACGSSDQTQEAVSAPASSSTSISASPSSSPTLSDSAPAPEETTAPEPSPESTGAQTEPVAAGSNCGHPSATEAISIYVSGGSVSCQEALAIFDRYNSMDLSQSAGVYGQAQVEGYDCYTNTGARNLVESRAGVCINSSTGGYLEARPAGLRIIPGPVEEVSNYELTGSSPYGSNPVNFYPAGSTNQVGSTVHCTIASEQVHCSSLNHGTFQQVSMGRSGAATIKQISAPPQALSFESQGSKPLDVGTTLTAHGISCQPQDSQSVRCVNADSAFTIALNGVVSE